MLAAALALLLAPDVHASLPRKAAVVPLVNAHSHNDYKQARPLFDALDRGFCSVEADVHLRGMELFVAHTGGEIEPGKTLRSLYLDPLLKRVRAGGGRVYPNGPTLILLVEFKSDAQDSYRVLEKMLEPYAEMLTVFTPDHVEPGAVSVIITGHRPDKLVKAEKRRLVAIDGDMGDRDSAEKNLYPLVSDNFGARFTWRGGRMEPEERARLDRFIKDAHGYGRMVRFWGAPDREEAWALLRDAGADLINTNKLEGLKNFLLAPPSPRRGDEPQAP